MENQIWAIKFFRAQVVLKIKININIHNDVLELEVFELLR